MVNRDNVREYADSLPSPGDVRDDEELGGYIRGVRDALKILNGETPDRMGRGDAI